MATIDLSQLPAPNVIESLDFETLFAQRKDSLIALYPPEQRETLQRTLRYESEQLVKLLQENTYHELLLRQRINEAAQANMLGYATGTDLDQLGANYNVQRLVITPADDTQLPPTPAVKESDRDFRLRIQQAFEGLSVAYQFHGRSADGRVADISVISPQPACVTVSVLSREGDGTASAELIAKVAAALNADTVRPVADRVTVQSARIVPYEVEEASICYRDRKLAPSARWQSNGLTPTPATSIGWGGISGCPHSMPPCMWRACSAWY
ncbi:Baseplate J-like protein [Sodalis glossinidius str. 'morsitans']|uniref:Baseplate J-like protein n=1 Tax=Sodalis glossinidius (strain morsitans) TaxID=343509 RepID=Q2NRT7_SODGM|nr:hypothetical phage protein [Sodalis glossinidius str. 'morsitans']BAE75138.1 phage baseplate assembly protein [Sodalis glossinidius str. 'morsitans']CRL46082.1 Baseplate J-like protein [Sodalis glossinidius str. 'morsitans']